MEETRGFDTDMCSLLGSYLHRLCRRQVLLHRLCRRQVLGSWSYGLRQQFCTLRLRGFLIGFEVWGIEGRRHRWAVVHGRRGFLIRWPYQSMVAGSAE